MTWYFRSLLASVLAVEFFMPAESVACDRRTAGRAAASCQEDPAELSLKDGPRPAAIGFEDLRLSSERDEVFTFADLPPKVAELYGKRVRIVGYAMPVNHDPQMSLFTLRRVEQLDPRGPELFRDELIVEVRTGTSIASSPYALEVIGTLSIRECVDAEGVSISVFCLEDACAPSACALSPSGKAH